MARRETGDNQEEDQGSGEVDGVENIPQVQADHESIAIGGISVGRDLSGEVNVAGRDIIQNINTIYERALTTAEEAAQARKLEGELLARGVPGLVQSLSAQAGEGIQSNTPYKGAHFVFLHAC